ncbi:phosphocholine-specific phospholipase C [Burkholderia gladioli]|uniref:phosphocholine-specific phospholipase C n=1 Tax=Burkholderia gladioli TaxID=28095 RepID=UPI001640F374|nr:phospholipase C, phosphocholine-specific [Burkholderia gladioli]
MKNKSTSRRQFLADTLKLAGASVTAGMLPASILRAQSIAPASTTGTIKDVKHIVILMQENRSFDQYLGTLPGVRGFGDPRPVILPSRYPVWHQSGGLPRRPEPASSAGASNSFISYGGADHGWAGQHAAWNKGAYDSWKSMQYFTDIDVPYYSALASRFTVCDAYHCSMIGPTDPNRLYMLTGCCGNIDGARIPVDNSYANETGSYDPSQYTWKTFPEQLNAARVSWKCYQDQGSGLGFDHCYGYSSTISSNNGLESNGNYGDNLLLYFQQYQKKFTDNKRYDISLEPAFNSTNVGSAKVGDPALFTQIKADVQANTLPQVSWIFAPYLFCEHPTATAGYGEWYVSNVLDALTSNPEVWASTVFFITYDENDGVFDHVPPPVPPAPGYGKSNVSLRNEFRNSAAQAPASDGTSATDVPIGLGPRVPMIVVSPWTIGGKINSQVFDHTSLIQFIEQVFDVPQEPNISDWRRAICGDLTSVFDFGNPTAPELNFSKPALQKPIRPSGSDAKVALPTQSIAANGLPEACRLPYEFFVSGKLDRENKRLGLTFTNTGTAGVALQVRPNTGDTVPRHYTIGTAKQCQTGQGAVSDSLPTNNGVYDLSVHGPNGFLQEYRGNLGSSGSDGSNAEIQICHDVRNGDIRITLDNSGSNLPSTFQLTDNAYGRNAFLTRTVPAKQSYDVTWAGDAGWYDVGIRVADDVDFFRRVAGCVQTLSGPWKTDSAIGNTSRFAPAVAKQGSTSATLRFDYVAPPWNHSPKNWIGVYPRGASYGKAQLLGWVYAEKSVGSVMYASRKGNATLPAGQYDLWFMSDDSYTQPLLGKPIPLTLS